MIGNKTLGFTFDICEIFHINHVKRINCASNLRKPAIKRVKAEQIFSMIHAQDITGILSHLKQIFPQVQLKKRYS